MNTPLKALRVLTLDCQTTGATPKNGSLLEIGWVKTRAVANSQWDDIQPTAYPFTLPIEVKLSSAIRRITGITPKELKNGQNELPAGMYQID